MPVTRRRIVPTTALGIALSVPSLATAQAISDNHFAIDLSRGVVIGPGRAIGMAGAYTALVDGVDGVLWNPAAFGARSRNSASFVRIDPTVGYSRIAGGPLGDFYNTGSTTQAYNDFNIGQPGLAVQVGPVGVGDFLEYYSYRVGPSTPGAASQLNVTVLQNHVGAGYAFFDSQLVVGASYRYSQFTIQPTNGGIVPLFAGPQYLTYSGHSFEVGAVWRPAGIPIRVGASFRSEADATHAPLPTGSDNVQRVGQCPSANGCFAVPLEVVTPWETNIGFAIQIGRRPFNVHWENPLRDGAEPTTEVHGAVLAHDDHRPVESRPVAQPAPAPAPTATMQIEPTPIAQTQPPPATMQSMAPSMQPASSSPAPGGAVTSDTTFAMQPSASPASGSPAPAAVPAVAPPSAEPGVMQPVQYGAAPAPSNAPVASDDDDDAPRRGRHRLRLPRRRGNNNTERADASPAPRHGPPHLRHRREETPEEIAARDRDRADRRAARDAARLGRRERYARRARAYLLLSFDLQIMGPVGQGEGIDAFMAQSHHASGRSVSFGPRLGAEAEVIPNWVKLRLGGYLEPSRYADVGLRGHITGGFDIKTITTTLFGLIEPTAIQISALVDAAPRYVNAGLSIGVWE